MMSLVALAAVAACAKAQVTDRKILVDEKVPRPDHIVVYDCIATPEELPSDSSLAGQASAGSPPQTAEQIALGREIGTEVAKALVAEIAAMGLPAEHATSQTTFDVGDLVIRGYLLTVEEGSATERVAIGMGKGAAELKVAVEGYQMTDHGLRKVGSGTLDTSASKSPGAAVTSSNCSCPSAPCSSRAVGWRWMPLSSTAKSRPRCDAACGSFGGATSAPGHARSSETVGSTALADLTPARRWPIGPRNTPLGLPIRRSDYSRPA